MPFLLRVIVKEGQGSSLRECAVDTCAGTLVGPRPCASSAVLIAATLLLEVAISYLRCFFLFSYMLALGFCDEGF